MADDTQELPLGGLFPREREISRVSACAPLAVRMRPLSLTDMVGHSHILGRGCLLPELVKSDTFGSLIFYGPPGCGLRDKVEICENKRRAFKRCAA